MKRAAALWLPPARMAGETQEGQPLGQGQFSMTSRAFSSSWFPFS